MALTKSQATFAASIARATKDRWLKKADKHVRADGRRSDCRERDLERAAIAARIEREIEALGTLEERGMVERAARVLNPSAFDPFSTLDIFTLAKWQADAMATAALALKAALHPELSRAALTPNDKA